MALRIYRLSSILIGTSDIADDAINAAKIAADAVTASEIAADAVTATEIAANAVTASEIDANAVGDSELDTTANFNFTGTLQKDGVALTGGDLFFCVVKAASTANIANLASGAPDTLAGVSLSIGDDVLVKDQSSAAGNGVYNVDSVGSGSDGAWTRSAERDASAELPVGLQVYDQNRQKLYRLSAFAGTVGTDAQTWEEVEEGLTPTSSEPYTVGTGDGSTLTFDLPASGIVYAAIFVDGIQQAPGTYSVSAGTGGGGVDQVVFGSGNAPASSASIEMIGFTRS